MEFKVKKDFLLVFLYNLIFTFLICISFAFTYNTIVFIVVFTIALSLIVFFDAGIIFSSCKIEEDLITFRTGAFKYDIKLKSIVKVTKSKNWYVSLSPSIDRIRILTKNNGKEKVYYISVVDSDSFIEYITKKIKLKDDNKKSNSTTKKTTSIKKSTLTKKSSTAKAIKSTKKTTK